LEISVTPGSRPAVSSASSTADSDVELASTRTSEQLGHTACATWRSIELSSAASGEDAGSGF
jgi:hypothetical protein